MNVLLNAENVENVVDPRKTENSNDEKENEQVLDGREREVLKNRIRELEKQLEISISERASIHQNDLASEVQFLRRQLDAALLEPDQKSEEIEKIRKTNRQMKSEIFQLNNELKQSRFDAQRNWEDWDDVDRENQQLRRELNERRSYDRENRENRELVRKLQEELDNAEENMNRKAEINNKNKENLNKANEKVRRLEFKLAELEKEKNKEIAKLIKKNETLIERNDELISYNSERNAVIQSLKNRLSTCESWLKIGLGKVEEFKPSCSTDDSSSETLESPKNADLSPADFMEIQRCQKVENILKEYEAILSVDVDEELRSYEVAGDSTEKSEVKEMYENYLWGIRLEYDRIQQNPDIRIEDLTGLPIFRSPLSPDFLQSYDRYLNENKPVYHTDMGCLICKFDVLNEHEPTTCSRCSGTYHKECLSATNSNCLVCDNSLPDLNEYSSAD